MSEGIVVVGDQRPVGLSVAESADYGSLRDV